MTRIKTAAAAFGLALLAIAPAGAQTWPQLAASAGLTAGEARGMTLTEIYVAKINRESGRDERVAPIGRGTAARFDPAAHLQLIATIGLAPEEAVGLSLSQVFALKTSWNARNDERHATPGARLTPEAAMSADGALFGLSGAAPAGAEGMSILEFYVRKINRESGRDDRVGSRI